MQSLATFTSFPYFAKVFDTRCFHKFGEQSVFRERTQHSVTFAALERRGLSIDPSTYFDAESALPVLELSSGERTQVFGTVGNTP